MTVVRGTVMGLIGALWGILGVCLMLVMALIQLTPIALDMFTIPLNWYHYLLLFLNIVFMAHTEGYKGFQQGFSPRVAARARYLREHPSLYHAVLAPLFCMCFYHSTKKRLIVSYALTTFIVAIVIFIRYLEQPWRGIVDAGVVVGLSWGLITLLIFSIQALIQQDFPHSPDLPTNPSSK